MDNRIKHVKELPDAVFKELGWEWFLGDEEWSYLTSEIIKVTEDEAEAFFKAGQELYEMFLDTADFIVEHNLFDTLDIPDNMVELIKLTWADERHIHLYGRFDLAGGVNGLPIKLLEFNADTPTSLPETCTIQWAQLKANQMDEEQQFNTTYEDLVINFKKIRIQNSDLDASLLISTMPGYPEDDHNAEVIGEAAEEAGFDVAYAYLEHVTFSPTEGIMVAQENGKDYLKYDFWFKIVPWEYIALEEPELMDILTDIVKNRQAMILNPAYTLLFQSKGIMKFLWDLHPNHPLLLKTTFDRPYSFDNHGFVEKVMFGREGANITIFDNAGRVVEKKGGEYSKFKPIYQQYAELAKDQAGNFYQAGLFYMQESNGIGFRRRDKHIVDEDAEFLGHYVG